MKSTIENQLSSAPLNNTPNGGLFKTIFKYNLCIIHITYNNFKYNDNIYFKVIVIGRLIYQ